MSVLIPNIDQILSLHSLQPQLTSTKTPEHHMSNKPMAVSDLCDDALQYILSFEQYPLNQAKCVNKHWRYLSNQNERIFYSEIIKSVNNNSSIPYDLNENDTWISFPRGRILTQVESELKFVSTGNFGIQEALEQCRQGDIILIFKWIEIGINAFYKFNKNIKMVGVGKGVQFDFVSLHIRGMKLYLENLKMARVDTRRTVMIYELDGESGELHLNECRVDDGDILIRRGGKATIENCIIDGGGSSRLEDRISICENAVSAIFRNNTFSNFRNNAKYDGQQVITTKL